MKAFYSVNMTLLGISYKSSSNLKHDLEDKIKQFPSYSARIVLMPFQALGACHGPFDTLEKATKMAANDLDENDVDYFGVKWCFIECEMKDVFYESVPIPTKYYVCTNSDCKGVQRFKGSCGTCKSKGKDLVPTSEVRDWDRKMEVL